MPSKKQEIIQLARDLRKNPTQAEELLWSVLRNRRLDGKKFTRQYPVYYGFSNWRYDFFIVDFCCAQSMLVVEVDGEIHNSQREYDNERTALIIDRGYKVLRIMNEELNDMEKIKEKIRTML